MIEQIHLYISTNVTKKPKILVCYLKKEASGRVKGRFRKLEILVQLFGVLVLCHWGLLNLLLQGSVKTISSGQLSVSN